MNARDDLVGQLAALRHGVALALAPRRMLVEITGEERTVWAERLLSVPVADLPEGRARRGTLMDGKGKLRCDLRVARPPGGASLLFDLPASHAAPLLRVLDMYILRDKVALVDRSADLSALSVLGPGAAACLERAGLPVARDDEAHVRDDVLCLASRQYGVPGCDLFVPRGRLSALADALREAGARQVGEEALECARLAAGVPRFDLDLADGVIPLEAGFDDAVSTTKGCYPGQEVVARIVNLGQVARRLARLSAEAGAPPAPGTPLHGTGERDGQEVGRVTSSARQPDDGRVTALGFVRRALLAPGTTLRAGDLELRVQGEARP